MCLQEENSNVSKALLEEKDVLGRIILMKYYLNIPDLIVAGNLTMTWCKNYYIDGRNTQLISLEKMSTGGGKKAPQITPQGQEWIFGPWS